jgi:AI-2 transport protein TqsA
MNADVRPEEVPDSVSKVTSRTAAEWDPSRAVPYWLLATAAAWYLLKELAPLLRPLLLAVFLAYVILPVRLYVAGRIHGGARSWALLAGLAIAILGLAALAYADLVDLSRNVPRLHDRAKEFFDEASRFTETHIPELQGLVSGTASVEEQGTSQIKQMLEGFATVTAGVLVEAIAVLFYLALILVEAGRLPRRMRSVFADQRAERILTTIGSINGAIANYLKAKVKVNVVLMLPVMFVLWLFGVKFVLLWGALTFFANFVPYIGSIVACALPLLFGFLDQGVGWQMLAVTLLLPAVHVTSAYVIEPAMTGKAVDLNPLVVLISLAFWGLCWGVTGMILAVPLTAMLKIILDTLPGTRPIAGLMGED